MQAEHTPGPWAISAINDDVSNIIIIPETEEQDEAWFARGLPIATMRSTLPADYERDMANARLIKAAPDLLNALKIGRQLLASFLQAAKHGSVAEVGIGPFRDIREIDAIIAKATGKK